MIKGYDKLIKTFQTLTKNDALSHGYIFFGERELGKATFAKCLANFMEFSKFQEPTSVLTELLVISPDFEDSDGTIGIDTVRDIKRFLYAKPVNSKRRIVLIDEAQALTTQAQNAILKIAEEPPRSGLLIIIVSNPDALLSTLQSRFQKVYFPRLSTTAVKEFLIKDMKMGVKDALEIAGLSFGRIGRAKNIVLNKDTEFLRKEVSRFLKGGVYQKDMLKKMVEPDNKNELKIFLEELVANLAHDLDKNYLLLKAILK